MAKPLKCVMDNWMYPGNTDTLINQTTMSNGDDVGEIVWLIQNTLTAICSGERLRAN